MQKNTTAARCLSPGHGSDTRSRRPSDWAGFVRFCVIGAWTLLSGWLPIAQRSWLAAGLIVPVWLGAFFTAIGFLQWRSLLASDRPWLGRTAAHVVTLSIPLYPTVVRTHLPTIVFGPHHVIAVVLSLGANVFAIWCICTLLPAMSLEPRHAS